MSVPLRPLRNENRDSHRERLRESERNADYVCTYLTRQRDIEETKRPELDQWIAEFEKDKAQAAVAYWYEMHKGIHESLHEF